MVSAIKVYAPDYITEDPGMHARSPTDRQALTLGRDNNKLNLLLSQSRKIIVKLNDKILTYLPISLNDKFQITV